MVQAAAQGSIDFGGAALLDRKWWLKLRLVLDRLEDANAVEVFKLQHAQHLAVVEYGLQQEAFDTHWKGANATAKQVFTKLFPWTEPTKAKDTAGAHADLMQAWKDKFGDLKDPEVKAKFDKIARAIQEHNRRKKASFKAAETTRDKFRRVAAARQARRRK